MGCRPETIGDVGFKMEQEARRSGWGPNSGWSQVLTSLAMGAVDGLKPVLDATAKWRADSLRTFPKGSVNR